MDSPEYQPDTPPEVVAGNSEDDGEEEEDDGEEDEATTIGPKSSNVIKAVPTLASLAHLRDVGRDAVCWSLSSAKPGNGVDQIRDGSSETYWQSDGGQPHYLLVHFSRRVCVSHVGLYLDYNLDESYTPKKVSIKMGMTLQDLKLVSSVEFSEPVGWCILPLLDDDSESTTIKTHLVELSILAMHQNGRDTHVRQVQLFGPRRSTKTMHSNTERGAEFNQLSMSQFSVIR
jgi:anaphase-promoting complex subunit 10